MSRSGRESLRYVREWSVGLSLCPGVVERTFRMSGVVKRTSRMSGSAREALSDVQEWSEGPP